MLTSTRNNPKVGAGIDPYTEREIKNQGSLVIQAIIESKPQKIICFLYAIDIFLKLREENA
jgi:hypothetical protein